MRVGVSTTAAGTLLATLASAAPGAERKLVTVDDLPRPRARLAGGLDPGGRHDLRASSADPRS